MRKILSAAAPRAVTLLAFCLLYVLAPAQNIKGQVTDAATGLPISGVSVYINNTSGAAISNDKGYFELHMDRNTGELVASHVAYTTVKVSLQTISGPVKLAMQPRNDMLSDVVVRANSRDNWKKWGPLFSENFIGNASLAKSCELLNPEAISFHYDKQTLLLTAHGRKPLILENRALGYRLHIDLDAFVYSFGTGTFHYETSNFYEPMDSANEKERARRAANRLLAYGGSQMHFVRALYEGRVKQEGFHVYQYKGVSNTERARVEAVLLNSKANSFSNVTNGNNTFDIRALSPDSATYYTTVMKQPTYMSFDSITLDPQGRIVLHPDDRSLRIFGLRQDTLLLAFNEEKDRELPVSKLKKLARFYDPLPGPVTYDFFQNAGRNHVQYSLAYLLGDTALVFDRHGDVLNAAYLFYEGWLSAKRMAFSLPWDYDPQTDRNLLTGTAPARVAAKEIEEADNRSSEMIARLEGTLRSFAQKRPRTTLYLHLDKTLYYHNENIWFAAYHTQADTANAGECTIYAFLSEDRTKKIAASEKFVMHGGIGAGYLFLPDSLRSGHYTLFAYTERNGRPDGTGLFRQPVLIGAYRLPYYLSASRHLYRGDSVSTAFLLRNDLHEAMPNKAVRYQLMRGKELVQQGKSKTNGNGQLILSPLPLHAYEGDNLRLLATVDKDTLEAVRIDLPLNKRMVRLNWYPEGGSLVAGLPSKTVAEARFGNGEPASFTFNLYEDDSLLYRFKTNNSGMAMLELWPRQGRLYSVQLGTDSVRLESSRSLEVLPLGYTLRMNDGVVKDSIHVRVQCSRPGATAFLLMHDYAKSYGSTQLKIPQGGLDLVFAADGLPAGLCTLTLLDSLGQPVAERTIFKEPEQPVRISLELDSARYHNRSKVVVHLKATDALGQPVGASLSVACVPTGHIDERLFQDINTFTWLKGYSQNIVQQPLRLSSLRKDYLELFLLTNCWTRYKWTELERLPAAPADSFSRNIHGTITRFNGALRKSIGLDLTGTAGIKTISTGDDGSFELPAEVLTTDADSKVSVTVSQKNKMGYTMNFSDPHDSLHRQAVLQDDPENHKAGFDANDLAALPQEKLLPTVVVRAVQQFHEYDKIYRSPYCNDWVCMYNILNCIIHRTGTKPMDGMLYQMYDDHRVLITVKYVACGKFDELKKQDLPGQLFYEIKGRYYSKEFYVADYAKYNPPVPEILTTVYWNPQILTNEKGEATITFYTNDLREHMSLVVEGLTPLGPVSARGSFETR